MDIHARYNVGFIFSFLIKAWRNDYESTGAKRHNHLKINAQIIN